MKNQLQMGSKRFLGCVTMPKKIWLAALLLSSIFSAFSQEGKTDIGTVEEFYNSIKTPSLISKKIKSVKGQTEQLVIRSKSKNGSREEITGKVSGKSSYVYFSKKTAEISGRVIVPGDKTATHYFTEDGKVFSESEDINKVLCIDYAKVAASSIVQNIIPNDFVSSDIYKQQSLPGAEAVVLLDFDGHNSAGSWWGEINALPANQSELDMTIAFRTISEDFRPFKINITTDESVYQAAAPNRRMRCIFTPTTTAYPGSGGVAFIGSYTSGGELAPCWVFNLGSGKVMGETGSHEIGHTMGLAHDGRNLPTGDHEEYYYGTTNWGPIMGASFWPTVTHWSKGEYQYANNNEDDISIIAANAGVGFSPDESGNLLTKCTNLIIDPQGLIRSDKNYGVTSNNNDTDLYRFSTRSEGNFYVQVNPVQYWPNLDMELSILNAKGESMYTSNPYGIDLVTIAGYLPIGNYYISIKGSGYLDPLTDGYSNYGSAGKYYLAGNIPTYDSICNASGTILKESWANISGSKISNLTVLSSFPNNPTSREYLSLLESPTDVADNFGSRIVGYICPPYSGEYTFWIAGDDESALYLSTNDSPSNKSRIAFVPGWTSSREWFKFPQQQSVKIPLIAGQKYYVEALHKEGYGGDNLAVGWQLPSGIIERPIAGNRLSPLPYNLVPTVTITSPISGSSYVNYPYVYLKANAEDLDGSVAKVEFYIGNLKIGEDLTSPYELTWTDQSYRYGTYTISGRAIDNEGAVSEVNNASRSIIYVKTGPTITTTSPLNNATYQGPVSSLFFAVEGSDPDGGYISEVRWTIPSRGGQATLIGVDNTYPFSVEWTNVISGTHNITVTAYDNEGNYGYAQPLTITVTNVQPTITITSPLTGTTFKEPAEFLINASARDIDGKVNGIQFFNGTVNLASYSTNSSASYNVTSLTSGVYTFTAVALDNFGAKGLSNPLVITVEKQNTNCSASGKILMEKFDGIPGTSVSNLTSSSSYPNSPSSSAQLTSFEASTNVGDFYGLRVRGYICAPSTGSYTFWIAGDDQVQLFLGTDANPTSKILIASHANWTNSREWNKFPSQKSNAVNLVSGQKYYIEALMKEGDGLDNLAVGWAKPGEAANTPSEVIPGNVLSPWANQIQTSYIFDDVLQNGWTNWGWNSITNFDGGAIVKAGSRSIAITFTSPWGSSVYSKNPSMNTNGYSAIRFWAYGAFSSNNIQVVAKNAGVETGRVSGISIPDKAWKDVVVNLNQIGNPTKIDEIWIHDGDGGSQYAIYVDEFRFTNNAAREGASEESLEPINVYPNPTTGLVHIDGVGTRPYVVLMDITGKIVGEYNNPVLDLSVFPKGAYLIKILTEENLVFKKISLE